MSDDSSAGYGNLGIGASGVPETDGGVIELGGSVVVGSAGGDAKGVFGTPHTNYCIYFVSRCVLEYIFKYGTKAIN